MADELLSGSVSDHGGGFANASRALVDGVVGDPTWGVVSLDPVLSRLPGPGSPGNVPAGADLRLDIGWDRFEQLVLAVVQGVLGLHGIKFRRYGVSGQAQHGIDLAGRGLDRAYTVVQCKEYATFTAADLRAAVMTFTKGRRPFDARHLIITISTVARTTQLEEELAVLQDEHPDLLIELWGAEQINDMLRERGDIVTRFWTRETAETFCTGAPLPGVPAAAPDWLRVAERTMIGPLGVDGLDGQLAEADWLRASDPAAAAAGYRRLAEALTADGYHGHAHVMWRKQLTTLVAANAGEAAADLAARLAATALHEGDTHQARLLQHQLDELVRDQARTVADTQAQLGGSPTEDNSGANPAGSAGKVDAAITRHAELISFAVAAAEHPLGDASALTTALRTPPPGLSTPGYQPLLVLLLAELTAADAVLIPASASIVSGLAPGVATGALLGASGQDPQKATPSQSPSSVPLAALDDLITSALVQVFTHPLREVNQDVMLRLRMLRANYDAEERRNLLIQARRMRLPRPQAALVLAAQARREALDGSAEEALEYWRLAVERAISAGRTDDASGWLYAIRGVNARYGPWTDRIDEEHLLAQALPKTTSGRLIRRVRDPENDARRAVLDQHPNEAITAARRWLADSLVTGDWVDEQGAVELLGDVYAANAEPERAAACYQWVGETDKLTTLVDAVGDRLLPSSPLGWGPWWQQVTSLPGVAAQADLLDDEAASDLLRALLDLLVRSRAGELIDGPTRELTWQVTKTACVLAARGTSADAQALLDLFASDVARTEGRYFRHDEQHVQACQAIAVHHEQLVWPALVRILDLAEAGAYEALSALRSDFVLHLLRERPLLGAPSGASRRPSQGLSEEQQRLLRARLQPMAAAGRYDAGVAVCAMGGGDHTVIQQAVQARDRLLNRPEPDGHSFSYEARMVSDAYMVTFLESADQRACLEKMLSVAADRREIASNRQVALAAASHLVLEQDQDVKAGVHARSRSFVTGDQDGSALDADTTNPHPLSTWKVNLGPASLRAAGMRLAQRSTTTDDDKNWVRDQAGVMLRSDDAHLVDQSAQTLFSLGADVIADLDAALLAAHHLPVVRQLSAVVAVAAPGKYAQVLRVLADDQDSSVRTLLAYQLHETSAPPTDTPAYVHDPTHPGDGSHVAAHGVIEEILEKLSADARHTVRRAAAGLDS